MAKYISSKTGDNVVLNVAALSKDLGVQITSCTAGGARGKAVEEVNAVLEYSLLPVSFPRSLKSFISSSEISSISSITMLCLKFAREESTIRLNDIKIEQEHAEINVGVIEYNIASNDDDKILFSVEYNNVNLVLSESSITINFGYMKTKLFGDEKSLFEIPGKGSVELSFATPSVNGNEPASNAEVPILKGNLVGVCNKEWFYPLKKDEQVKRLLCNRSLPGTKFMRAEFSSLIVNYNGCLRSVLRALGMNQNVFMEISVLGECTINLHNGESYPSSSSSSLANHSGGPLSLQFGGAVFYVSSFEQMFIFAKYSTSSLCCKMGENENVIFSTKARESGWDSWSANMGNDIRLALSASNVSVILGNLNNRKYSELIKSIFNKFSVKTAYLSFIDMKTTISERVFLYSGKAYASLLDGSWWVQPTDNSFTCILGSGSKVKFCEFSSVIIDIKKKAGNDGCKGRAVSIRCLCDLKINLESPEVLKVAFLSLRDFACFIGILEFRPTVKKPVGKTDLTLSGSDESIGSSTSEDANGCGGSDDDDKEKEVLNPERERAKCRPQVSVYDPQASPSFVSVEEDEKEIGTYKVKRNRPKVTILKSRLGIIEDYNEENNEIKDIEALFTVRRIEIILKNIYKIEVDNLEYKKVGVTINGKRVSTRSSFIVKDYSISLIASEDDKSNEHKPAVVLSNDREHLPQYYVEEFNGTVSPALKVVFERERKQDAAKIIIFLQSFYVNFDGKLIRFLDNFTKDLNGELGNFVPLFYVESITLQPVPSIKFDCVSSFVSIENAVIDIPQRIVLVKEKSLELLDPISVLEIPGLLLGELGKMSKIEILKDISMSAKNPICSLVRVIVSAGKVIERPILTFTGYRGGSNSGGAAAKGGNGSTSLYEFTKDTSNFVSTLAIETMALGKSLYTVLVDTAIRVKGDSKAPVSPDQNLDGREPDYVGGYRKGWFGELYDKVPIFFSVKK